MRAYIVEYEQDGIRRSELVRAGSAATAVSDVKRRRPRATVLGVRWG